MIETERASRTAVVLGASGFVGRHVCAGLARDGWAVLGVSRTPAAADSPDRRAVLDLAAADLAEIAQLFAAARPALVVNASGAVWRTTVEQLRSGNDILVGKVVEAVAALATRPRFVQLGSTAEYGPVPPGTLVDESAPARPASEYGRTKLAATRTVLAATEAGRLDGVVLRVANVIGPGTPPGSLLGTVAATLARAAREGTPATLDLFTLSSERDFVDVRDVADAVAAAAGSELTGQCVNIGAGEAVAVRQLVTDLVAVSGVEARLVERDATDSEVAVRGKDMRWHAVDVALARRLIAWRPRHSLRDSVRAVWAEARRVEAVGAR
ncbi:NAD-dependent epimerase/dehydratase family protein [Amycolatopsis sp. cg13]|uniref:NAD-dependent epimerase/dehydratase family protein n=1 Tax=Amycolatopsis sp. cg13 TaxID=3238807 RepID=UPI0035257894